MTFFFFNVKILLLCEIELGLDYSGRIEGSARVKTSEEMPFHLHSQQTLDWGPCQVL